ncbi:hypothetical protein DYU11_07320 [Fibrisoma montanum]|uniref:DNA lyase n=1 Tax=Fibrisoma montanum TaxID=2305895 RepID=A0A418ME83_9BACT|nr:hypothetical protein [Fibrisoma montanum]RIV25120.1 hypothetical protein DYU11_07320 [Fibrisoma montanum]
MKALINARILADYILNLSNFCITDREERVSYNHIGALLADVILQSGLNYKHVVFPRVQRILIEYSEYNTTTSFHKLLDENGPRYVINWTHPEKINRIMSVISLLKKYGIRNEDEFKFWLTSEENVEILLALKGIGPKTIDYLKGLLNIPGVAVDRHVKAFIAQAGLRLNDYSEIKKTVEFSADLLGISRSSIDYSIWVYMSEKQYIISKNK